MSLTTLAGAFVVVGAIFIAAGLLTTRWGWADGPDSTAARPGTASAIARVWPAASFEALLLTLIAALWFGSLGHGGWVLLFLLLGALTGTDRLLASPFPGGRRRGAVGLFVASLLKYLLAGLACVWRLT
jgi:hypothetical protein